MVMLDPNAAGASTTSVPAFSGSRPGATERPTASPETSRSTTADSEQAEFEALQACLRSGLQPARREDEARQLWDRFYARHQVFVRRVVRCWGLSPADTDDCAQEAWVEIFRKLGSMHYDPQRGRLRSWMATVVRRQVIQFLRRKSRTKARSMGDFDGSVASRERGPADDFQSRERREAVLRTLRALRRRMPEKSYQVLYLRRIEERSTVEVAESLDLTPQQVRYRLRRAQRKLRVLMQKRA